MQYSVIGSATKMKPVCVLTVLQEDGSMDYLEVKDWVGENGNPLIGTNIIVSTTNKEIIPSDIKIEEKYPEPPTVG